MQQALLDLVQHYGYLIVGVGVGVESMGVPVPGETVLLIGAVVAGHGQLAALAVGLAGFCGAVLGDNAGYTAGRRWGRTLLARPWVQRVYTPERVAAADRFFERRGWLAVFLGRFAAILRIFAGPLAGLHRMPWPRFLVANALGAAIWVTTVVLIGLLLGSNLDRAASLLTRSGYAGLAAFVLALAGAAGYRRLRRRGG